MYLPLLGTIPIDLTAIKIIEKPPAIVQQVKPELTVKEKIAQNYYKCKEDIEWIRADNARCLAKVPVVAETRSEPIKKSAGSQVSSPGNGYTPRNCTWYAKSRRPDLPNNLGDSINWASNAAAQGFATGSVPRAGSIGQQGMHVVYIEAVNGDGTVYLSEMNYDYNGGFRYRTAPASDFKYIY